MKHDPNGPYHQLLGIINNPLFLVPNRLDLIYRKSTTELTN